MANTDPSRAALGSDAWMLEQQLRAEWEASEWRRIRAELALPPPQPASPTSAAPERPWHEGGSGVLKGLVRFGIGAFGAWMGYIAAATSDDASNIEIGMAVIIGFFIALMISMLSPFKPFVALLAEITRWVLIFGVVVGAFWFVAHMHMA